MEVFVIKVDDRLAGDPGCRWVRSHDFFDGFVREVGVRREQLPLVRVLHHCLHREPELVPGRVHAPENQEAQSVAQFIVAQTIPVAVRFDESRHKILARICLSIGNQAFRVSVKFVKRLLNGGELVLDGDPEGESNSDGDARNRWPFAFGNPRQNAQHASCVRLRKVIDEFQFAFVDERIDKFGGELLELRDIRLDVTERKCRVQHASNSVVVFTLENQQALRPPVVEQTRVDTVVVGPLPASLDEPIVLEELAHVFVSKHGVAVVSFRVPVLFARVAHLFGVHRKRWIRNVEIRNIDFC